MDKKAFILRKLGASYGSYRNYVAIYVLCEVLNVIIVELNILAIDYYLDAPQYGVRASGTIPTEGVLSFSRILWPSVAKCELPYTGPGGVIST
jgi:hypothetical protein